MPNGKSVFKDKAVGVLVAKDSFVWFRRIQTKKDNKPLVVVSVSTKVNDKWESGDGYFFEIKDFGEVTQNLSYLLGEK